MSRCLRPIVPILSFVALFSFALSAQETGDTGWRISPNRINIQMGADRPLQLLDDNAQELHDAQWTVDNPDLADLNEEDGLMTLHAKAVGTVRVSATLNGEVRVRDIKIWSAVRPIPNGKQTGD